MTNWSMCSSNLQRSTVFRSNRTKIKSFSPPRTMVTSICTTFEHHPSNMINHRSSWQNRSMDPSIRAHFIHCKPAQSPPRVPSTASNCTTFDYPRGKTTGRGSEKTNWIFSPVLRYGESKTCSRSRDTTVEGMSVTFNSNGSLLFALRRRLPPVLFKLHQSKAFAQFDANNYVNLCTMKSGCFLGDEDQVKLLPRRSTSLICLFQYIASGSDDFNVYVWRVPKANDCGPPEIVFDQTDSHLSSGKTTRENQSICIWSCRSFHLGFSHDLTWPSIRCESSSIFLSITHDCFQWRRENLKSLQNLFPSPPRRIRFSLDLDTVSNTFD